MEKKAKYKVRVRAIRHTTKLRIILRKKKMTMRELAELADMEIPQISNICSGKQKDMLLSTAKRICNSLNISLDDAFRE